jgi:hypothetical protein
MNNPIQNEAETQKPERENSLTAAAEAQSNDGTGMFITSPDTMLSMTVLLLACLALAALAYVLI